MDTEVGCQGQLDVVLDVGWLSHEGGSQIPAFLELADSWKPWHTSGHASKEDIGEVIRLLKPSVIIPMHTESPELMREIYGDERIVVLGDGEAFGVE